MAAETFKRTTTTKRTVKGTFLGGGKIEVEIEDGNFIEKSIADYFDDFEGTVGEFSITQKKEENLDSSDSE